MRSVNVGNAVDLTLCSMADQHVENEEFSNENPKENVRKQPENSILDNFNKLKHSNDQIRIKAGIELLRQLTENKNDEKINELKYALTRLIRGLGAANLQIRTGHFIVLVGLFSLEQPKDVATIFEIIDKELHKSGSNSKSENADICLGQILTVGAIIRSNYYQNLDDNDKRRVIEQLINAGKTRDYLPLIGYNFLLELLDRIDRDEFEKIRDLVVNEAVKPWQQQNLDSLYLLQQISVKFPGIIKGKLLKNTLGTSQILCRDSLPQLCTTLTTILKINSLKHPIYDSFVGQLIGSDLIADFCVELDRVLLKSNRNRYLIVTKLLTKILENLDNFQLIPDLLQKNFVQQTINNFKNSNNLSKSRDKEFHEFIKNFFDCLIKKLKDDRCQSSIKLEIIKKFLFYPGTFIFEKITRTKLIQNITQLLDTDRVKQLCQIYWDVVCSKYDKIIDDNNTTEKWWNLDRIYAASLLIKLLNHQAMIDENDWKIEQLKLLMDLSLFNDHGEDEKQTNIGQELADSLKETFYTALDLKLRKLDDLCYILNGIVKEIDQKINQNNLQQILRHPIDLKDYEIWQKTNDYIAKITTKKPNNQKRIFHILFLHLNLQLFNNNNTKLASDSLQELFNCYQRTKKKKILENHDGDDETKDPTWIEVIIDLFLNLLSHKSRLIRDIINCVFPYLCPYLTLTTIHQIITAIDPKIEENPLDSDTSDDSASDDDEEEEEEDNASDSDDDEDQDQDDETINDKFRTALQQVLTTTTTGDEDIDLDQLNDDDGTQLDRALADVFKQFKPNLGRKKSNKQKKSEELLTHFRIRVLDLIEIYLNTNPALVIIVELIQPLLEIFEFCVRDNLQKPLQDRCRKCLKKLTTLKQFAQIEGVTIQNLLDLLEQLLDKGTKNSLILQDMGEIMSDCCVFLINTSQLVTTKSKQRLKVAEVLRQHLEQFFAKRDCLIPFILFKNVLNLNWNGILLLIPLLYQVVYTETVRPFRRTQALELLKIFYQNHRFLQNSDCSDISEAHIDFLNQTVTFFERFCNDPKSLRIRERFISNLFNLLIVMKQSRFDCYKNWSRIAEFVQLTRSIITISKDTRDNYRKLCRLLGVNHVVAMRPVVVKLRHDDEDDDDVDGDAGEEKVDKKRKFKLSKDTLKMKKETKLLRLQSLSEGFNGKRKMFFNGDVDDDCKKSKID